MPGNWQEDRGRGGEMGREVAGAGCGWGRVSLGRVVTGMERGAPPSGAAAWFLAGLVADALALG